jgi:phosphoribosylaminoimidazole-succinocarboxamide synthase
MSNPNKSKDMKMIYEGSVKRLWQCPDDADRLWFQFTDDYSIFDWGKMPDTIANKGRALAFLGAHFFEVMEKASFWNELKESKHLKRFGGDWLKKRFNHPVYKNLVASGLTHHFKQLNSGTGKVESTAIATTDKVYMEVLKAETPTPEHRKILNHELYFYPHTSDQDKKYERRLIPLEIVFRFGMPEGSSLTSRLQKNPGYLKELGLPATPTPGEWFPVPVIEFFTKLEPSDRLLSWTEASLLSGLSGESFEALLEATLNCALALYHLFAEKGLELWDGKFEFVVEYPKNAKGENLPPRILLADSIGPDELRLIYRGHHLSKELIRQIYKDTDWANALQKSKDLAKQRLDSNFKRICIEELKQQPAKLSDSERAIVDALYGTLANHLAGSEVFPKHPTMDEYVDLLQSTFGKDKPGYPSTTSDTKQTHCRSHNHANKTNLTQEKEISIKSRGDGK